MGLFDLFGICFQVSPISSFGKLVELFRKNREDTEEHFSDDVVVISDNQEEQKEQKEEE